MARTALVALLFLGVASPLWGEVDNPSMGAHGIGSSWTYTISNGDTLTAEIIDRIKRRGQDMLLMEIGGNLSSTRNDVCNGYDAELYDAETGSWSACLKDGKVLAANVPHDGRFSFPMAVGDTWVNTAFWTDNVNGQGGTSINTWQVVAYESVTVQAGTFMAFRIDYVTEFPMANPHRIWYAPAEKLQVKWLYGGDVYELSDYEVVEHVPDDSIAAVKAQIAALEAQVAMLAAGQSPDPTAGQNPDPVDNNTGRAVPDCLETWWEGERLYYRNTCSYTISIAYCDATEPIWGKTCGDNPSAEQPYYTHMTHLCAGDDDYWWDPGTRRFAVCQGYINPWDVQGEFTSDSSGNYGCHNDLSDPYEPYSCRVGN